MYSLQLVADFVPPTIVDWKCLIRCQVIRSGLVTREPPILIDVSERFGCRVREIWSAVLMRVAEGSEKGSVGRASFRRSARAYSPVLSVFSESEMASRAAYALLGVVGVRFHFCRKVYASGVMLSTVQLCRWASAQV